MGESKIKWRKKEPEKSFKKIDPIHRKLSSIYGIEDLQRFLYPTKAECHSPYLLKNIKKARDRIIDAIKNSEKICIFSDP